MGAAEVYLAIKEGFKIYVPAFIEEVEMPSTAEPEDELNGNETILMVEDEEGVRMMATMVLESYGYRVLTAANGVAETRVPETLVII